MIFQHSYMICYLQPNMPTLEDIEDKKKYDEEVKLANIVPRPGAALGVLTTMDSRKGKQSSFFLGFRFLLRLLLNSYIIH